MKEELINIWRCLFLSKVDYLTVGGFAVNIYGFNRNTGDIDILVDDNLENRKRLRHAIKDMGIGDFKELETVPFIAGWTDISLNLGMRLDIMSQLKGLEGIPFIDLKLKSTQISIEDFTVDFLDYESLIKTKQACNRPKDILDIEELEKINGLK
ncbi:hypothetical protein [Aquiflexum sp.]|uniref:hypothetical protein n=1 Tax=Aquiflexum sp. TaxID=1872584 RepID=UPI0035934B9D